MYIYDLYMQKFNLYVIDKTYINIKYIYVYIETHTTTHTLF